MTGSLLLKSLSDPVSPEDGKRILVTRWPPRCNQPWWHEWMASLSPSSSLLRHAKRLQDESGDEAAWKYYRPRYVLEMSTASAQDAIQFLRARLQAGETITLLCYCRDERYCHRSLLRDLILEVATP